MVHGRPGHELNRDYSAAASATTTSSAASATTTSSAASATTTSTASFSSFAAASAADAAYSNGLGIGGNGNGWSTTAIFWNDIFWTHVVVICIDIVVCTGVNSWNSISCNSWNGKVEALVAFVAFAAFVAFVAFASISKLAHGKRTHAFTFLPRLIGGRTLPIHV